MELIGTPTATPLAKRGIIFSGGIFKEGRPPLEVLPDDLIICADAGCEHLLKLGIEPHVLIGDLDSIGHEALDAITRLGVKVIRHPAEKNKTDTQLSLEYAIDKGVKEVLILAALGGRIDHIWANVGLLWLAEQRGIKAKIVDEGCEIFIITGRTKINGEKGDIFSLFPVGFEARGVGIKGAKYPLFGCTLRYGDTLCVSNEFVGQTVEIEVGEGALLLMKIRNK